MWLLAALGALVVVLALGAVWYARRLDRLHRRVDSARVALDAALGRRAGAAADLAAHAAARYVVPSAISEALAVAAAAAITPVPGDREGTENDLGRAIRDIHHAVPAGLAVTNPEVAELLEALDAAIHRVALARAFYNGAVEDTRLLRRSRFVRWLRLAGRAPLPSFFEIDDAAAVALTAQRARPVTSIAP